MTVVVNTFLGCFKLRTGCLFMGYSGAITSFLLMVFAFVGLVISVPRESYLKGDHLYFNEIIIGACIFILVTGSIAFCLYVVLLVGLHQYRPKLLKVFLISMTIYMVITFVLALILTVMNPAFGIRVLISYAWSIYYMLVCRSYYFKMKEEVCVKDGMKPV